MELRNAKKEDLDSLIALRFENAMYHSTVLGINALKANANTILSDHTHNAFNDINAKIIVAIVNDKVVGYVIGFINQQHPIFDFGQKGLIDDIYVEATNQGMGFGQLLVEELFKWFRKEKTSFVELNVYQANVLGLSFWEKMDFNTLFYKMIKEI